MLATQLAQGAGVKVVLMVDQFEELFTQTTDERERKQFIDLLVTACTELDGPLLIILTLRGDFYDRPMYYKRLGKIIEQQSKSVFPMNVRELKAVIQEPARLPDVQLTIDEKLVAGLLYEIPERENALPLLEFTLLQLFQRRNGHCLTLQAYDEIGRIKGALIQHAEATHAALPSEEHRNLVRALFVRLIEPGATEQDSTRRRAPYSEFALDDDTQSRQLKATMHAFIRARLLTTHETTARSPKTNEVTTITTIEVTHEALIREWPRLATWLREARDDIPSQIAISNAAAVWERCEKSRDRLYRGSQLREAKGWAKRNLPSSNEMAFLRASTAHQRRSRLGMATLALTVLLPILFIAYQLVPKPPSFPVCTLTSAPSPTEPVVYVGSGSGSGSSGNFVYALRASNGQRLWQCQVGNSVYSSSRLVNGVIYVGSKDTNVYAFRADNGSLLWRFPTKDIVQSSPDVIDGVVYIGSNDGYIYALRAKDGSLLWHFQAGAAMLSSPVVVDSVVYIASFDGNIYALRAKDGHLNWHYLIGKKKIITSSPAVVNGVVYISLDDSTVYTLAASDGHLLWKHSLGPAQLALGVGASSAPFDSSPTVEGGTLYVGSRDGSIYALRTKDGSLLWSYQTGASIYSSPAVVNGVIYIGSGDDYVYALQASDGHLKWKYKTGGHVISLPVVSV